MTFILPVSAFMFGLLLAQFKVAEQAKKVLSSLLARLFIPAVIIYNMVFYQAGSLALMGFSFITSIILWFFPFFEGSLTSALCEL